MPAGVTTEGRVRDVRPDDRPSLAHRTNRHRRPGSASRPATRPARHVAVCRPCRGRVDRLYGPGKCRDEHPGLREIRLRTPLGCVFRQSYRHAVPGALGQDRDRHRAKSGRTLPRAFSAPRGLCDVGSERNCRNGDGAGGTSRRQPRPHIAVRRAFTRQHVRRRDRHLRGVRITTLGFQVGRDPDLLLCQRDHP